jgi:hydroxymethylpyrimidine/phosphomethylpyrimidine kinase
MKEDKILRRKANAVKDLAESSIALTIAGFDPSSGAGVTADLQVFAAHGVHGVSAITALTVQSTREVRRVEPVNGELLRESLECLAGDLRIGGVKIGMLGTAEAVGVVAGWLREAGIPRERVVLDPVIRASSGAELLSAAGVERLRSELLPLVGWVTPNLAEAGVLLGEETPGREGVPEVAVRIQAMGAGHRTPDIETRAPGTGHQAPDIENRAAGAAAGLNVVVTGGHLEPPDDFLLTAAGEGIWFPGRRVEARGVHGTHGTGCAFSSALLCRLMLGDGAAEAVAGAKAWVVKRLGAGIPGGGASGND